MTAPVKNSGSSQSRIDDLLLRWDEARERGEAWTVSDLCRDCPELAAELERRIRALGVWDGFVDTDLSTGGASSSSLPVQIPGPTVITLDLTDLRFHARGGLGAVFRAHDGRLARELAVKFPERAHGPFSDQELEQRLLREVAVTASLEHPGIVPVYGVGQDAEGRPCYAMRFISGETLKTACRDYHVGRKSRDEERRPREPLRRDKAFRDLLGRFRSACVTVAYAHSQGFLHRDLKPDHILLGAFDATLVVDWGLTGPWQGVPARTGVPDEARPTHDSAGVLRTEVGMGTLGYASPEQQTGDWHKVGPASDVFSLGATLYELLTGSPPFTGASAAEVISQVERGIIIAPRVRNRDVPRALEAICLKALAVRPEDRYESAQTLAEDLERWLADAPVAAHRDDWSTRARRWIDRHRAGFFAFVAATVVAGCTLTAAWHFHRLDVIENRSLAYAAAERAAREHILTRRAGWVMGGLDLVDLAEHIATPLRSRSDLRGLAISCLGGIDLRVRGTLTSLPVGCLAFSPDGNSLAVGELFGERAYHVELLDIRSRRPIWRYELSTEGDASHRSGVSSIGFSADGRKLAAGLRNGKTLIWDPIENRAPLTTPGKQEGRIIGLGFASDGATLVSVSKDGVIMLRDRRADRDWVESRAVSVSRDMNDASITLDGTQIICGGIEGGARYEVTALRGRAPTPMSILRRGPIGRVALSPDARMIAYSTDSSRKRVIGTDPFSVPLVDPGIGVAHQDNTDHLEFSPDGSLLISGSADNTVKVWDMAERRLVLRQPVFSESMVLPRFHPAGHTIAVGSTEGVVLYDVLGVDTRLTMAIGSEAVSDFAFLESDGAAMPDLLAFRSSDRGRSVRKRSLELWSGTSTRQRREQIYSVNPGTSRDEVLGLEAATISRMGALRSNDGISILDLNSPSWTERAKAVAGAGPIRLAPDGKRLWGILNGKSIASWSVPDLTRQTTWVDQPPPESRGRKGISCLATGDAWVLAGTRAGRLLMLSPSDGSLKRELRVSGPIEAIAMTDDSSIAFCGTQKGDLDLVRLAPDASSIERVPAHTEMITGIAFHRAGRMLVTCSRDGFLAFWKVGHSLTELARIRASQSGPASEICFSADGRWLGVLIPGQRAVRVWDLVRLQEQLENHGLGWDVGE